MVKTGLLYDGSTGHLVRDGASTNHLVYVRWNEVADFGAVYSKVGDAATFAAAKSAMEAATWASGDRRASSTYQLIGTDYYCEAAAIRFDLDEIGMTGSNVLAWRLRIGNLQLDTSACRVGFINQAGDTPTDNWTWLDGAASTTRTTEGWLGVHFGAVAARYVFAVLSMHPYAEPAGAGGEYFLHDDATSLQVYF